MSSKTCKTCGERKASSEFYSDKRNRDGRYSECSDCTKADRKARWPEQRKVALPRLAERRAAEREADPEGEKAKAAKYYQEHKAARNAAQRRYRAKRKAAKLALEGDED